MEAFWFEWAIIGTSDVTSARQKKTLSKYCMIGKSIYNIKQKPGKIRSSECIYILLKDYSAKGSDNVI